MNRYKVAHQARHDLTGIYRHIHRENPAAATRLRHRFQKKFSLLAAQPLLGQIREDLPQKLRAFTVGNYVILYRPESDGIAVVRVLHAARDLPAAFRET